MIKANCGCKIELLDAARDAVIHHCPLHGAALDLLAALRAYRKARAGGDYQRADEMADAAIAKAGSSQFERKGK